jgi:hypothetical protein
MTPKMTQKRAIKSVTPCPECGGHWWWCYDFTGERGEAVLTSEDYVIPLIDLIAPFDYGVGLGADECSNCRIFVS